MLKGTTPMGARGLILLCGLPTSSPCLRVVDPVALLLLIAVCTLTTLRPPEPEVPSIFDHIHSSDSSPGHIHGFSLLRAASEPPPDAEVHRPHLHMTSSAPPGASELSALTPVREYSWEWGAFPQPSPVRQTFGKTGRADTVLGGGTWGRGRGKEKAKVDFGMLSGDDLELDNKEVGAEWGHGRSRSVPPELDGSPTRDRRGQPLPEGEEGHFEADEHKELPAAARDLEMERDRKKEELVAFGQAGKLGPSKADSTRFILQIVEKKVAFEVSVPFSGEEYGDAIWAHRMDVFDGRDEVEAARIFSQGKVDFEKFLHTEDVVHSPNLVIRWADHRYLLLHTLSQFNVDIYIAF